MIDDSADHHRLHRLAHAHRAQRHRYSGAIHYSGLATLNIKLGSGGNTLNVTGSANGTATTNVNAGTGYQHAHLRQPRAQPWAASWTTSGGNFTLTGSGADALAIDDTGSSTTKHRHAHARPP